MFPRDIHLKTEKTLLEIEPKLNPREYSFGKSNVPNIFVHDRFLVKQ